MYHVCIEEADETQLLFTLNFPPPSQPVTPLCGPTLPDFFNILPYMWNLIKFKQIYSWCFKLHFKTNKSHIPSTDEGPWLLGRPVLAVGPDLLNLVSGPRSCKEPLDFLFLVHAFLYPAFSAPLFFPLPITLIFCNYCNLLLIVVCMNLENQ